MDEKKKSLAGILVPVLAAVVVAVSFAVSGHITKNMDAVKPTAQQVTEEQTEPVTQAASKVTIVAVGDNLIHNTLIEAGKNSDNELDYTSFYANMKKDISAADIAVINQETMLGGADFEYSGYPQFNSPWEIGTAAIDAGFDIFTCATNHSMDVGFKGIEQECKFFDEHPEVTHVGTNDTEEEYNSVVYYTKNDIKFALLNYTYGTNGIPLPEGKSWCINMMDKDKITADVTAARQNADVVMVFPHWGTENSTVVSDYQQEYVQLFYELGVDIVIGTHPHVLQSVEWFAQEGSDRKMLVYYSLGNFISHQTSVNQLCGGMAKITVEKNNDTISISSAKLTPLVCWYSKNDSGKYSYSVYKLGDYTNELADSHAQKSKDVSPEYFTEHSKKIISDEFLEMV